MYMAYAYLARQNSALPINMCAADNRVNSACPTSRQLCLIVEGTKVNLVRQEALVSELITSGQAYCNRQCVPLLLERPHGVLTLVSLLYSRDFLGRVPAYLSNCQVGNMGPCTYICVGDSPARAGIIILR